MSSNVKALETKQQPQGLAITVDNIRKFVCPKADNGEIEMFMVKCRMMELSPFTKEVYLIKYSKDEPASVVIAKDTYLKISQRDPDYSGFKAGIVVENKNGNPPQYREGTILFVGDTLIGGWCEVFAKNRVTPVRAEVMLKHYDSGKFLWKRNPAMMIRKVALVQAHREAFSNLLGGVYDVDEMKDLKESSLTVEVVEEPEPVKESKPKGRPTATSANLGSKKEEPVAQEVYSDLNANQKGKIAHVRTLFQKHGITTDENIVLVLGESLETIATDDEAWERFKNLNIKEAIEDFMASEQEGRVTD